MESSIGLHRCCSGPTLTTPSRVASWNPSITARGSPVYRHNFISTSKVVNITGIYYPSPPLLPITQKAP